MVVISFWWVNFMFNKKKIIVNSFLFVIVSLNFSLLFCNDDVESIQNSKLIKIVSKPDDIFSFKITSPKDKPLCQPLIHLKYLKQTKHSSNWMWMAETANKKQCEDLINRCLTNEQKYQDDFFCFYHGQQLEFLLLYLLYECITEKITKKNYENFYPLRLDEDPEYDNIKNVAQFIKKCNFNFLQPQYYMKDYWDSLDTIESKLKKNIAQKSLLGFFGFFRLFISSLGFFIQDDQDPVRKLLLSVTPSFFGLNYHYFMNSNNAFFVNTLKNIKKLSSVLDLQYLYKKHKDELQKLQNLLNKTAKNKTGILLQIFVPKKLINEFIYKARPGGSPYHNLRLVPLIKPTTAEELNQYYKYPKTLDYEFRIIVNNKFLLNPNSDIKIFKYYNDQTENMKTFNEKFAELRDKISDDLNQSNLN
ncbi:hypothetical protein GF322_00050 [Candidatus Dependentiae bacterium]|nr:hypothetical protein [Candidatus Dependentiae bacterium]